jgi:hypothetical protein
MSRTQIATDPFTGTLANWALIDAWAAGNNTISSGLEGAGGSGGAGMNTACTDSGSMYWSGTGSFTADQYASAVITGWDFQSTSYVAAVLCRASGTTTQNSSQPGLQNFYAAVVCDDQGSGSGHTCAIVKVVNGSASTLGATVNLTYTNGDTVEMECTGSSTVTLNFFQNGVSQFTRTDSSSPITSGSPGIMLSGGGIGVRASSWEGGNVTAAPAVSLVNLERGLGRGAFRGQY